MFELQPGALDGATVEAVLRAAPGLVVGVLGDLYLDRYFDLDAALTEPSLETGLDAYQVVRVRSLPGAAGTVVNNLAALGVGEVRVLSLIGDDGEGYELRQALAALPGVSAAGVVACAGLRTPTYLKPMLGSPGGPARELNRLDIHNRRTVPAEAEGRLLELLEEAWPGLDGLVALDQVSLPECGVLTRRVRERLAGLAEADPGRVVLADSRERIGLFRGVMAKPNRRELLRTLPGLEVGEAARRMAAETGRDVFCTLGEGGILHAGPDGATREVPGYPVAGPVDPVGAGDSTSAGIVVTLAAGAAGQQAAAFGNLVASITVQQIGTTGTATPAQVRRRWAEVARLSEPEA